jgi:hypothetical protein
MPVTIPLDFNFEPVRREFEEMLRPHLNGREAAEADRIMVSVKRRAEEAIEQLGGDVADDLRKSLSVPVDYSTSPPTRSKPGEFPRMDSGDLLASVNYTVYRTGGRDRINLRVVTDKFYDAILIASGRRFDAYILARWSRLADQRVAIALR